MPETLGAIELSSIARGVMLADLMVKKAPINLLDARAYCPGKFLILLSGDLASVEEALEIAVRMAGGALFADTLIPNLMPEVIHAINRKTSVSMQESIAVVEAFSAVSIIDAADAAMKAADVCLQSISLLEGLGGKAYFIMTGLRSDVTVAVEAALERIPPDMRVESQTISQISSELYPFFPGWK